MRMQKIIGTAMLICFLVGNSLMAQIPENELKNQIIKVNQQQLESLGFKVTDNKIEVIANDVISKNDSQNKTVIKRKLSIKRNGINLLSPNKAEKAGKKVFPVRMAVLTREGNTASYYSRISDAEKYLCKNGKETSGSRYLSDNNWKALYYKFPDNAELYIWFDADDLEKMYKDIEKMPKEIEKTPEPMKDAEFLSDVQISPNPTRNGKAEIKFYVNTATDISISLYDIAGRKVLDILPSSSLISGMQKYYINGEELSDGMYLIVIQNDKGETITKKLIKTSY